MRGMDGGRSRPLHPVSESLAAALDADRKAFEIALKRQSARGRPLGPIALHSTALLGTPTSVSVPRRAAAGNALRHGTRYGLVGSFLGIHPPISDVEHDNHRDLSPIRPDERLARANQPAGVVPRRFTLSHCQQEPTTPARAFPYDPPPGFPLLSRTTYSGKA